MCGLVHLARDNGALERLTRPYTVDLPSNSLASEGRIVGRTNNHGNTSNHAVRRYEPFSGVLSVSPYTYPTTPKSGLRNVSERPTR